MEGRPSRRSAPSPLVRALGLALGLGLALALSAAPSRALAQRHHTVRPGQSLALIARRNGVRIENLAAANGMAPGDSIRIGQVLIVPARGVAYVREGQTLSHIARANGCSIDALARANRLRPTSTLRVGQRLVLPGFDVVSGDTPAVDRDWGTAPRPGVVRLRARDEPAELVLRDSEGRVPRQSLETLGRLMRRGDGDGVEEDEGLFDGEVEHERAHALARARATGAPLEPILAAVASASPDATLPEPRLALLLAAVSDHFGGREIVVVSGIREARGRTRETSRHVRGAATDIRIEGVSKRSVWDFCRSLTRTGCGLYPRSIFVHVDVRDDEAQWVDWSGPGERSRYGDLNGPRRRGARTPHLGRRVTRPEALPLEVRVAEPDVRAVEAAQPSRPAS